MSKVVWMEMLLLGASILVFRSVWAFLDSIAWASGGVGLTVLFAVGVFFAIVALRAIQAPSMGKSEDEYS